MKFITTAPDRRTLVKAIAEHTGMEPSDNWPAHIQLHGGHDYH